MFTRELKEGNSEAASGQVNPTMGLDLYEVGRALADQNDLQWQNQSRGNEKKKKQTQVAQEQIWEGLC